MRIRWLPGAEEQRDALLLEMKQGKRLKFKKVLQEALEQIEVFPESGRVSVLTRRRDDIRDLILEGGYRMTYAIAEPEEIVIFSLLPLGTSQALD